MSSIIRHPSSYRMPAEWEPQAAIWLAWPHNKEDWPDKFEPIPWVYAEIIRHIAHTQVVRLVVQNDKEQKRATDVLERAGVNMKHIKWHVIPTDRIWLRDSGPIFVKPVDGGRWTADKKKQSPSSVIRHPSSVMLDWRFNAWAKYPNHKKDDKVPEAINTTYQLDRIQPMHKGKRVVLEGGSIDVNGKGTLITTEECLLSNIQCRNPGFTRDDYAEVFARYLGISQIIWLGHGIVGDDTHGHVDDITRFVKADTIVTVVERDKRDDNYSLLQDNLKRLKKARDAKGKAFNIVELPMPRPVVFEGQRLPASYANFLICNEVVLVPTFNDPMDRIALNILAECFPKREVVGIHAVDLVWGLGTIHCMSQQEPA
ncbi:MAG: agmatine deiminase family protein [Alphaproteobacteria bacterium]|nr:agmatine deiminase family protein [Alphaproteobacteria bacterium]